MFDFMRNFGLNLPTRKEFIFLFISIPFGLALVFLMPPFENPDENAHFIRSWEIASGQFACLDSETGEVLNTVPNGALSLPNNLALNKEDGGFLEKFNWERIRIELVASNDYASSTSFHTQFCGAVPIGHIPNAFVFALGKTFHYDFTILFYTARIINLFLSIFLVYLAIKIAPIGKMYLLLVALFPMAMQQFSSLSYDALHVSLSLLFFAILINLRFDDRASFGVWEKIGLVVLSIVALNIKFGYFPLSLLIFLLPERFFSKKKSEFAYKVFFVVFNVLSFFVFYKFFHYPTTWPFGVDVNQQIGFVLRNPFGFLGAVVNAFEDFSRFYVHGLVGIPGSFRRDFPDVFYGIFLIVVIFSVLLESRRMRFSVLEIIMILLSILSGVTLLFFILYLIWTPVGAERVEGVQGRYFLVFMPLLLMLFQQVIRPVIREKLVPKVFPTAFFRLGAEAKSIVVLILPLMLLWLFALHFIFILYY